MLCQCYKMSHFVLFARGPNLPFNLRSLSHLHHSNTSLYLTHFVLSPINASHKQNLSVSGGSGKVSYLFSGQYYGQEGVYKIGNEAFDSYNLRAKITAKPTNTLTFDINTSFSRTDYSQPIFTKNSDDVGTQLNQIMMIGFPVLPPYNEDGTFSVGAAASGYASFVEGNSAQEESRSVFASTLGATWEPFKDVFKIRADFSYKNINKELKMELFIVMLVVLILENCILLKRDYKCI